MHPVESLGATVRVQAGAVTQAVHEHCAPHGLTWPVDFASKGSSTVGGNIATNAGGVKVIRYGLTRNWVLGLQVVLASGEVLELNGALEKNNTGLDLRQLFIGSEGTLGVVTEATLKLARLPGRSTCCSSPCPISRRCSRLFRETRRAPFTLAAYEFFTDRVPGARSSATASSAPRSSRGRALRARRAGRTRRRAASRRGPRRSSSASSSKDGDARPDTRPRRATCGRCARGSASRCRATGLPHKNDVALPVAGARGVLRGARRGFASRYPGWEICLFGHIGDGNLHVNVMKPDAIDKATFLAEDQGGGPRPLRRS